MHMPPSILPNLPISPPTPPGAQDAPLPFFLPAAQGANAQYPDLSAEAETHDATQDAINEFDQDFNDQGLNEDVNEPDHDFNDQGLNEEENDEAQDYADDQGAPDFAEDADFAEESADFADNQGAPNLTEDDGASEPSEDEGEQQPYEDRGAPEVRYNLRSRTHPSNDAFRSAVDEPTIRNHIFHVDSCSTRTFLVTS
jgi:hypothetical protein